MAYLDDILKGTRKINNNVQTLGSYSPLTGFSNEDELSKNPYQQILSSMPSEKTDSNVTSPLNSNYLESRSIFNKPEGSFTLPDGVNIDSTFYNRKDIYDLKKRLNASGIDIPDGTKDSPGLITRVFDLLSTPGYAVTTALYNALDGDDSTGILKGLVDGTVSGITADSSKRKEGSDLIDLAFGKRTGDEGFLEKTGRFLGGVLLDTALDPTTYLTLGTSALVNGATKQVGEEVTEQAVKNAIKGVNEVGELAKAGKMLNLDDQAKRIAKQINENAVKKRSGMVFEIPFTKIEKEIISAEKISEIGKKLGLQDTIGKAIDKGGDLVKGAWNLNKSDDGIRASLEKLPEAIGRKFDTDYDLKKLMKSDPLKASEQIASKEIKNLLSVRKEEVLEEAYNGVKELIELMNDNGIDSKEASSLLEKLETHNIEKELTPESMLKMIDDSFLGVTNIGLENSTKAMNNAEIEMRKRMQELLQGKVVELENLEKVDNLLKQNGIEVSTKASIEEKKKLIEEIEKSKLPTPEELGIGTKDVSTVLQENNVKAKWQLYSDEKTTPLIESIRDYFGVSDEKMDEFLSFDTAKQKRLIEQQYKKLVKENSNNGRIAKTKLNELNKQKSDLITSMYGLSDDNYASTGYAKLKNKLKSLNKDYGIKETYEVARTTEDVMKKLDDVASKEITRANEINFNLSGSRKEIEAKVKEYVDELFKGSNKTKLKLSKSELVKSYTDTLMEEAKSGVKETTLSKALGKQRNQIGMQVEQMKALKEQTLKELGLHNVKGADDLYDKMVEQIALNMLDYNSKYYVSPFETVTLDKMKGKINTIWKGVTNSDGEKVLDGLFDLAKKYGPEEIDKLYDGTSFLLDGNYASILGTRSKLNADILSKLRAEGINKAKAILYGSGVESDMGGVFDSVIKVVDTTDINKKIMRIDEIPRAKGQKPFTKETLPKKYKIVSDEGIVQKIESAINNAFAGEKGKKFYNLTKDEQNKMLSKVDDIVNKIIDETEHFGGKKLEYLDMKDSRLDFVKKSEKAYDNYEKIPLREKRTYTNQEYLDAINDSEILSKEVNSALKGDDGIRSMQNTPKKGAMLEDLKLKAQDDLELMEQILQDSDISYQDSNKLKKLIKQRKTDIKAIDKEIDIYNEFINSTEKFGQEFKNDRILNSEITGRNKELDLSELGTKTELNKKQEFIEKRLKELDDIDKSNLTDVQKQAIKNERLKLQKQNKQLWDKKNKDFDKNSTGRNTVMNTKSWGQPEKTVNVSGIFDDSVKPKYKSRKAQDIVKELQDGYKGRRRMIAYDSAKNSAEIEIAVSKELPNGIKLEKVVGNEGAVQKVIDNVNSRNINKMNVKELKQMLSDAGVKGISKSNRAELVEIANLINSKNVRASIDLSKKTPEEMQRLLKQLGIKDADFDRAVQRFTGAKNQVDKYKASKDAIEGVWKDNNISKFTNTMENLFGEAFINKWNVGIDNLNAKSDNFKVTGRVAKTPIELIADNKEVIEALGGGEKAEEFVQKYVKLMQDFGQDEISWGIFTGDESLIKSQGYVARRMSDETREILNGDVDKNNFLEAWFRDRRNMIYDDPKFAKQRTGEFKTNIAEINEAIYKATKEKFGEEGAIENFFERDLSRILIQRAYEHGNAFYDKNLQTMYLGKMGVQMSWAKGKNGAYNIVESVNGAKWNKILSDGTTLNELQTFMKSQDYESLRKEIKNFLPNDSYIPDAKLQKVIDNSLESLDRLENYLKAGAPNKKKLRELRNDVFANLPQRGFARELQAGVKNGDIKLIYPSGQSRELTVNAIKEDSVKKILNKDLMKNDFVDHSDFTELSWKDFEKISTTTNEVPVYAVNKQVYEAYQKAMTEQLVKDKDNFLQVYDKFMGYWKKMATTSVGFHVRNIFGNQFQMYLDVGREAMKPKWLKIAKQVSDDSTDVLFKAVDGTEYTGKMVNDLFKKVGLDDVTQMNSEFNKARKGKKTIEELLNSTVKSDYSKALEGKSILGKVFATSQFAGDYIEKLAKRQQFSILLEKGYDPLEAKRHVDKFLFDYNDLTDFETDFMKRIIPFYTFAKKNLGLQIDTIMNNPTPVKTVRRMLDNQRKVNVSAEEERLITDNDNDKIILDFGGKKRTISTNLPWVQDTNILGAITPLIKTPLEMATNKNFTFGTEIESYEGQMKEASPLEGILGGLLGQTEIGADGKKYINAKAKHLITNALPSVRTMDRSLENVTSDDKLGGLMAFLGLGGQEFSTEKRTSYEVREYKELLENLEKKAQSMGINTREELKKKQQLEALLQQLGVR